MLTRIGLREQVGRIHVRLRSLGLARWVPLVPEVQFARCVDHALGALRQRDPRHVFGDYLEFGVSRGSSMAGVYHCLRKDDRAGARLIGFDSFEGMPPESAQEGWEPGAYASPIGITRRYLRGKGVDLDQVTLVKGWFNDTLNDDTRSALKLGKASLVMIDCDIYSASKKALEFAEPHLHDHAVLIFDDWGWREQEGERGQKEAFAEFLDANRDLKAEPLPSYLEQARVFLVTRVAQTVKPALVLIGALLGFELAVEAA